MSKPWAREHVDFCEQAILSGASLVQTIRACVERLGLADEEAMALYDDVRQRLSATSPLLRSIAAHRAIYRRAMAANRFAAAAKVQAQLQALEEKAAREEAATAPAQALASPRTADVPPGKPSAAPRARRISMEHMRDVEKMLDSLTPHGEIVAELCRRWGLKCRQVNRIMAKVYKTWEEQAAIQGPHRRNEMRRRLETLAREARTAGEYHAAIIANDRICRLDGLYAPQKVELNVGVQMVAVPQMTDAEAAAHLEATQRTLARARAAGLLLPAPADGKNVIDLPLSAVTEVRHAG